MVVVCSLPWQGLKGATKKQKYDKIREKKVSTPVEVCCFYNMSYNQWTVMLYTHDNFVHILIWQVLCKSHHVEFASYFQYCRSLTFEQRPDYGFLKRLFRDLFTREGRINTDSRVLAELMVLLYSLFMR